MEEVLVRLELKPVKNIALIAHDAKKGQLIRWCQDNYEILKKHNLFGTGTTSALINEKTGLDVHGYNSGPLGGDLQVGRQNCRRGDRLCGFLCRSADCRTS